MFTSGCRPWLKNVACLSSLLLRDEQAWFQIQSVKYFIIYYFSLTIFKLERERGLGYERDWYIILC